MSENREFTLAFVGLKPGISEFGYDLGNAFFDEETSADFNSCHAQVRLLLDKHPAFLTLKFEIGGNVKMVCNRCSNPLEIILWDDFEILIKLVDNPEEMNLQNVDPDIFYISWNETHLNVHDWINEFVQLTIPTHPVCGENEEGESKCDKKFLAILEKLNDTDKEKENTIWEGLNKFKIN